MEYFKSSLKSVLGAPDPGSQPSGADTVINFLFYFTKKKKPTCSVKTRGMCICTFYPGRKQFSHYADEKSNILHNELSIR